jgi:hypothetical protein
MFQDVDCIDINTLCDMIHANSRDKMNCNLPLHLKENLSSVFENIKYAMLGQLFFLLSNHSQLLYAAQNYKP